jgi:hypothetical protein
VLVLPAFCSCGLTAAWLPLVAQEVISTLLLKLQLVAQEKNTALDAASADLMRAFPK